MDEFHISNRKNNKHKSHYEYEIIRKILHLPGRTTFARCGCKDRDKVRSLEKSGDLSHGDKHHICELCRCDNAAGERTRGWYYWPKDNPHGLREVGHYGVGPCWKHEGQGKYYKSKWGSLRVENDILKEIEIVQQRGLAPRDGGRFIQEISARSEDASLRRDVRKARESVRKQLDDFAEQLKSNDNNVLTDRGGLPMSLRSKIELTVLIAKALSDISKSEFLTAQNEYIHKDEMIVFVNKLLQICEQFIKIKEDWDDFIVQFKQALFAVRSGDGKSDKKVVDQE